MRFLNEDFSSYQRYLSGDISVSMECIKMGSFYVIKPLAAVSIQMNQLMKMKLCIRTCVLGVIYLEHLRISVIWKLSRVINFKHLSKSVSEHSLQIKTWNNSLSVMWKYLLSVVIHLEYLSISVIWKFYRVHIPLKT